MAPLIWGSCHVSHTWSRIDEVIISNQANIVWDAPYNDVLLAKTSMGQFGYFSFTIIYHHDVIHLLIPLQSGCPLSINQPVGDPWTSVRACHSSGLPSRCWLGVYHDLRLVPSWVVPLYPTPRKEYHGNTNKRGSMTIQFPVQLQYIVYTIFLPIQTMFCLWICSFMTSRPRTWNTRGMGSIILTSTSTLRQLRGLNQLQRSRRLWQSWLMILRRRGSCQDGRPKSRGDPWDILGHDSSSSTIDRGKLNGFSQGCFWNFIPLPEAPLSRLSLWWLNQQYLRWRAGKVGYLVGSFSGP